jgi:hypothetical protein
MEADRVVHELAKIAFANIGDFAKFSQDGKIDVDFDKAREIGAVVSVVERKVGRGKNARTVRTTSIKMPDCTQALIKLGKHLGLFNTRQTPTAGRK